MLGPGGRMPNSRRNFLTSTSLGLLGVAAALDADAQDPTKTTPGAPPAYGTGPAVGPEVSVATFAEAEKLVQIKLAEADRSMAANTWRVNMASLLERRTGPHTATLEASLAPYSSVDSVLPGEKAGPLHDRFVRTPSDPGPLPSTDAEIAFSPVTRLSRWIEQRKLTSERLTNIYLKRIEQFDPKLRCVITLTKELALAQAKRADAENRRWKISRSASRHSVGWQRSAGHCRHSFHLRRRTISQSHSEGRRGRGAPLARSRRGAHCKAQPWRSGAERYLVRRANHESLVAGRRRIGLKRWSGLGDCCGIGWIFDR